jgi:type IV pilus assembly protein PilE
MFRRCSDVMHSTGFLRRAVPVLAAGFTAIELVIVMAIVGILSVIAFTSYLSEMRRSARADLQALATSVATRQSQFLVDRRRYAESLATLGMSVPPSLSGKYTLTLVAVNDPAPRFTLTAVAIGNQAHDKCPTLPLDNAGNRTPAECW